MSKKKKGKKLNKGGQAKLPKSGKKLKSDYSAVVLVSVDTGKKWKKVFKQKVKVSKPIGGTQIDMFFDTNNAVRGQIVNGAVRFKKLLGIREDIASSILKKLNKAEVIKLLAGYASKQVFIVTETELKGATSDGVVKVKLEIVDGKKGKKKSKKQEGKKKANKKKAASVKSKATNVKKISTIGAKGGSKTEGKLKPTALVKATTKVVNKAADLMKKDQEKSASAKKAVTTTGAKRSSNQGVKRTTSAKTKKITNKKTTAPKKRGPKPSLGKPGFDDLKRIKGIGTKMENILNSKGIKTYKDLKGISVRDLQGIINGAGGYYQSFKPQVWKSEAALAAAGKFDQMQTGRR